MERSCVLLGGHELSHEDRLSLVRDFSRRGAVRAQPWRIPSMSWRSQRDPRNVDTHIVRALLPGSHSHRMSARWNVVAVPPAATQPKPILTDEHVYGIPGTSIEWTGGGVVRKRSPGVPPTRSLDPAPYPTLKLTFSRPTSPP